MERSLVIIKPDAVERNLTGDIIKIYESNNLKITNLKMLSATKDLAEEHYKEHYNQPYFNNLISYITRSPIVAMVIEGENVISKIRTINGATKNPDEGTIRKLFALSTTENSVHASDSIESANREIKIWFK